MCGNVCVGGCLGVHRQLLAMYIVTIGVDTKKIYISDTFQLLTSSYTKNTALV